MRRADLAFAASARRLAVARKSGRATLLVTGFRPFGSARVNASEDLVRRMALCHAKQLRIVPLILQCAFHKAPTELSGALRRLRPTCVVAFGEAERDAITPERVAANLDDARIPDNRGRQPKNSLAIAGGPAQYPARLPVESLVRALRRRGLRARASDSAGTYVCNHLFFALMHSLASGRSGTAAAGFVHVPALRGPARLRIGRIADGISRAIQTTLPRKAFSRAS